MAVFIDFLVWISVVAAWGNLLFWVLVFLRIPLFQEKQQPASPSLKLSLILCARNEAENLQKHLRRFLSQDYRSLEILVVNHKSDDHTQDVLLAEQKLHPNFRIVKTGDAYVSENKPEGKKQALAAGIEASTGDVLLLSDADCEPAGPSWASGMASRFQPGTDIVLGFSPYRKEGGILNAWIRFEAAYTAMQYLGFALAGVPYMGVGRNLAYRRSVYERAGGFHTHNDLLSGDDDLMVNATANRRNTSISLDPETFVVSDPATSWKQYWRQKSRHMTTAHRYRLHHRVFLALLAGTQILHYTGGVALMMMGVLPAIVFIHFVVRMVVIWTIAGTILKRFREPDLVPWIPLLDAAVFLYYLAFLPTAINGKTEQWNLRQSLNPKP